MAGKQNMQLLLLQASNG